jgi:threonine dehydratase
MFEAAVTMQDVYKARRRIAGFALRTPLIESPDLTERIGVPVHLKLENVQRTGAFKIRGAANKLLSLSRKERERGVITVSSGNHGRAVAYVARQLGVRASVCVSTRAPGSKIADIRRLGAEVVVEGESYDDAVRHGVRLHKELGLTLISSFDDPYVIAGQGTIGLELLEDLPAVDTVVNPVSGGSLMSGVALTLKSANPSSRAIGVSMERAPVMFHSLKVGHPIEMEEEESLADALTGGIGLQNRYTFDMVRAYVDEILLVSEEEIADAMAFALKKLHLVVEGAGAVTLAAVLHGKLGSVGKNVVVVISGGNVGIPLLLKIAGDRVAP